MSMDEKEIRDDEEGRPEDEEAQVKISPILHLRKPLLPFSTVDLCTVDLTFVFTPFAFL